MGAVGLEMGLSESTFQPPALQKTKTETTTKKTNQAKRCCYPLMAEEVLPIPRW
jgi:hypothetical protein